MTASIWTPETVESREDDLGKTFQITNDDIAVRVRFRDNGEIHFVIVGKSYGVKRMQPSTVTWIGASVDFAPFGKD